MAPRPLPVSAPSAQGVDARGVSAFLDALEAAPDVDPHSLVVVRHGHVVAAGWWAPYTPERVHLLYSLSKSFTSAAAGLAVAEGMLDLDDTVLSHFPELDGDVLDARSRAMRVRHVAAMASGHLTDTWQRAVALDPAEVVRGFLLLPPEREPGTAFAYNQPCTYALAAIVQRACGQTLTAYLRPRLLDPVGIGGVGWQQHPRGRDLGFSGLHATTDAVARLGLLHLQHGRWDGRAVLARDWVDQATRPHVANPDEPDPDWRQGYGFQFWMSRHGYRGDGAYGQFCLVLPGQDAVVAITAETPRMQLVLDAVWEHLLPALSGAAGAGAAGGSGGDSPGRDADDEALARRLSDLALPALRAQPQPPSARQAWAGADFTPTAASADEQPTLTGVHLAVDGDGWALTLAEADAVLTARLGTDGWAVTEAPSARGCTVPLAVSGGWTGEGTLAVEVVFLETPHRLLLTCALADRSIQARWATRPLHGGSLHDLRAPRPLG